MKSENLLKLIKFGIPVPNFVVVEMGDPLPNLDGGKTYVVRSNPKISMAGILDSKLNVSSANVSNAVEEVFESWNTPLAKQYRKFKNISDELAMSVIIQKQVNACVDGGFSGILHTVNPVTGVNISGSYVDGDFAENLCTGITAGKDIFDLPANYLTDLQNLAEKVEKFEGFPQDIEFVFDGFKLLCVQMRPAQLTDWAFFTWLMRQENQQELLSKFGKFFDVNRCYELVDTNVSPVDKCIGVSGAVLEGIVGEDIVVLSGGNIKDFSAVQSNQNIILRKGNIDNHFAVEARKGKKNCVIWDVPEHFMGKFIWVEIKTGYVFTERPELNENSFKNKFLKLI